MPKRKPESEISEIHEVFSKYRDAIISNSEIVSRRHNVWNLIQRELTFPMTTLALFTVAKKNYHNIWNTLHHKEQIDDESGHESSHGSSDHSMEIPESEESLSTTALRFEIKLSRDIYNTIKPEPIHYLNREYSAFKKGAWTHVIYREFYKETKLPCRLIFKRAKVFSTGSVYATITGKCSNCCSVFTGSIINQPSPSEENISIKATYEGRYFLCNNSKARPLSGLARQNAVMKMTDCCMTPSLFQKMQASEHQAHMEDSKPVDVPRLGALRTAKYKSKQSTRFDENPMQAIVQAKYLLNYTNIIRGIGADPFFVHYWSNSQMKIYNRYVDLNYSSIQIDATGGVVSKLKNSSGYSSSHIFLYEITIRDKLIKKQYSVCNMLSQSQNALSIYFWLSSWIRSGADYPNEIVTDMSKALLYACVNAFTEFKTLHAYIEHCYKVIFEGAQPSRCYIRNDIAHLIKLMSNFKSFKVMGRSSSLNKRFYMTAFGQVAQCSNIDDLKMLLEAVFTVALSETEGWNAAGQKTTYEERKEWLLQRVSTGSSDFEENVDLVPSQDVYNQEAVPEPDAEMKSFKMWCDNILKECEGFVNVALEQGNRGNQQFFPEVIKDFMTIAEYLPLWSNIMGRFHEGSSVTATTSSVESNFNDLKNRLFSNKSLPLRVDEFLLHHVKAIDGAIKLAASNESRSEYNASEFEILTKRTGFGNHDQAYSEAEVNPDTLPPTPGKYVQFGASVIEELNIDRLCSSCQLNLDPRYSRFACDVCHIPLHNNSKCVVKKDDKEVCLKCAKKNLILEQSELENWRGLAKSRKRKSYLEPNSEFLYADLSRPKKVLPIGVLKNGNREELRGIPLQNRQVTLKNTCAFDSIIQIVCSSFCDSDNFHHHILAENYTISSLVESIATSGITAKTYRMRAEILSALFPSLELHQNIFEIDCVTTVTNMITKMDFRSARGITTCECGFAKNEALSFIEVEVDESNLQNSIRNNLEILVRNTKWTRCQTCHSQLERNLEFSNYFFLEPVNTRKKTLELSVPLEALPINLFVKNDRYTLRGVVGFQGPKDSKEVGHFVGYCRRHNNLWEEYNDLHNHKNPCSRSMNVRCFLLLYTL